jgi:hypothetical protein
VPCPEREKRPKALPNAEAASRAATIVERLRRLVLMGAGAWLATSLVKSRSGEDQ